MIKIPKPLLYTTFGASLAASVLVWQVTQQTRPPEHFILPEGYVGWVEVFYEAPGAKSLPTIDGYQVVTVPVDGRVRTSSRLQFGVARDRYSYRTKNTGPSLIDIPPTGIWPGSTSSGPGGSLTFFVGTRTQEKNCHNYYRRGAINPDNLRSGRDLSYSKPSVLKASDSFPGASFFNSHFAGLTLLNKDFSHASFVQTDLKDCRLTRCTFRGADLYAAVLKRTNFTDVDFRGAILDGADFRGATFVRVDFRGAVYDSRTQWPKGVDPGASGAIRLDNARNVPW